MKTKVKILIILLVPFFGISQSIEKFSIDSGGSSVTQGNIEVLQTLGEVSVQELVAGGVQISEGFINPLPIPTPDLFITKWLVGDGETITIPTFRSGYNYNVDWSYDAGDGFNADVMNQTGNTTSAPLAAGEHTVAITGDFPRIFFNNKGDKDKIIEIIQWGTNPWTTMDRAFAGCSNLNITNPAVGVPDLSLVTNMSRMFNKCASFNSDIGNWNVSNVTDMSWLFALSTSFNQDLSNWNTTNVTNMRGMFNRAFAFNSALGWDVSNVEAMERMFEYATAFNQDISNWDTSSVVNMFQMFKDAESFDQNLGAWDIGSATNMGEMFKNIALSTNNYDNTLIGWAGDSSGSSDGIDDIPTSITFDGGSSTYCTGETARNLLTATLPAPTGYGWTIADGGSVCGAPELSFITKWMVLGGETITFPLSAIGGANMTIDWGDGTVDTGLGNNPSHTYTAADTYTVMVSGAYDRVKFNNSGDKDKITEIVQWGTNPWSSMQNAFSGCSNLNITNPNAGAPNLSSVTNMRRMFNLADSFNGDVGDWDVSNVTDMSYLFKRCRSFNQDINDWNTSNATTMREMFNQAWVFNGSLDWDVSNVETMEGMFFHALAFNQDISNWDTSNVTSMYRMFNDAQAFDQNLGSWDIGRVTTMVQMFFDAELSTTNYDATLMGWAEDTSGNSSDSVDDIPTGITFDVGSSTYCAGETARILLIAELPTPTGYGWTITDGGLGCAPPAPLLGINHSSLDSVSLYPNPTQNSVTIISLQTNLISATIYDVRGRKVSEVDFRNQTTYHIDLSDMEAAVYFIEIATESGTVMKRVLKK